MFLSKQSPVSELPLTILVLNRDVNVKLNSNEGDKKFQMEFG